MTLTISRPITADQLRSVLHYDQETGIFTWLVRMSRATRAGDVAGSGHDGYVRINIRGQRYMAHVLAWLYVTGEWPPELIDHWDTVRNNNAWANLRLATGSINAQNQRRSHSNSSTGVLGVRPNGDGFQARISLQGRRLCLGTRATKEEAQRLYIAAKRELHPGNTL